MSSQQWRKAALAGGAVLLLGAVGWFWFVGALDVSSQAVSPNTPSNRQSDSVHQVGVPVPLTQDAHEPSVPDSAEWLSKVEALRIKIATTDDISPVLTEFERLLKEAKPGWVVELARQSEFSDENRPILHVAALYFGARADSSAVNSLTKVYAGTRGEVARIQLGTLVRFVRAEDAIDTLTQYIASTDHVIALDPMLSGASFAVASTQNPLRVEKLITLAAAKEGSARFSVADGFLALKSPNILPVLTAIIDGNPAASKSRYAKEIAVRLLGQIKDETSRDYLKQIELTGDDDERVWASESRIKLQGAAPGLFRE